MAILGVLVNIWFIIWNPSFTDAVLFFSHGLQYLQIGMDTGLHYLRQDQIAVTGPMAFSRKEEKDA